MITFQPTKVGGSSILKYVKLNAIDITTGSAVKRKNHLKYGAIIT